MFQLASPWLLCFLPIPWLLWFGLPRLHDEKPAAVRVPFYHVVSTLVANETRGIIRRTQQALFFLVWVLLVIALSGPQWVGEPRPLSREGYNIMMALDVSGSMEMNDMIYNGRPISRLNLVKLAAEAFVRERSGDRIGLILFGSRAYLQTPLTYDRQAVLKRIDDATVGLAGKLTAIGDALGLAVKRLQNAPQQGRVVILLTDGVNNAGVLVPLKAAEIARADQVKIYTIGLGAESDPRAIGGLFQPFRAQAELDEATLKQVAEVTGGQYFRASDSASLQSIYQKINRLEKMTNEQETLRPQKDYFQWPLAIAVFLLLGWLINQGKFMAQGILGNVRRRSHVQ